MIAKNSKISNCNIKFIEEKITFFKKLYYLQYYFAKI